MYPFIKRIHITTKELRISFVNAIEKPAVTQLLSSVCNLSSEIFKSIKNQF